MICLTGHMSLFLALQFSESFKKPKCKSYSQNYLAQFFPYTISPYFCQHVVLTTCNCICILTYVSSEMRDSLFLPSPEDSTYCICNITMSKKLYIYTNLSHLKGRHPKKSILEALIIQWLEKWWGRGLFKCLKKSSEVVKTSVPSRNPKMDYANLILLLAVAS